MLPSQQPLQWLGILLGDAIVSLQPIQCLSILLGEASLLFVLPSQQPMRGYAMGARHLHCLSLEWLNFGQDRHLSTFSIGRHTNHLFYLKITLNLDQ